MPRIEPFVAPPALWCKQWLLAPGSVRRGLRCIWRWGYLYFIHLLVSDERTDFSDNYFDLAGGESHTVMLRNDALVLTPDRVTVRWR